MTPPDKIEIRTTLRHAIEEAIEKWRDEDVTAEPGILNMYSPDDVKMLARAIRDAIQEKPTMAPDARWQALKARVLGMQAVYQEALEHPESERKEAIAAGYVDALGVVLADMTELEAEK